MEDEGGGIRICSLVSIQGVPFIIMTPLLLKVSCIIVQLVVFMKVFKFCKFLTQVYICNFHDSILALAISVSPGFKPNKLRKLSK